jgi:TusA-related sulfurtransferase
VETGQPEVQGLAELALRYTQRAGTRQVIPKETAFLPKVAFTLITVASMAGAVFTGTGSAETSVGLGAHGTLLDNRQTPRAVGLTRAATRMRELSPGALLEIWSRDHFAPMEIPLWAERDGYKVVIRSRAGAWPRRYHVFVITKPITR